MAVTAKFLQRAKLCGACKDGLPPLGAALAELNQKQLRWAEDNEIVSQEELVAEIGVSGVPLSLLAGSGYGDGSGSGSGDGYGDGYGDGSGSGSGDGYDDGDGYGDGSCSGSGYGYGYGDGSGSGSGS